VSPSVELIIHAATDIETGGAARAAEHAEIPANGFPAVGGIRRTLEDDPALAIDAAVGVTIVDRGLAGIVLIGSRIKPDFHRERFGIGRVESRVKGNNAARGGVVKLRVVVVAD